MSITLYIEFMSNFLLRKIGLIEVCIYLNVVYKPSKTIIKNNLRDLRYYSHLFSQHCFNNKKQCTSRKKTKNAQPRLEPAPFERPIVV